MGTGTKLGAGALACACLSLLAGCAVSPPPTPVERDFGLAHHLAIYGQQANPAAGENLEPVEGIAGGAARGAYQQYIESFGGKEREAAAFTPPTAVSGGAQEVLLKIEAPAAATMRK
jgi:hypothetical protein